MIWSGLGTTTKLIVSCCHKNDWRRPDFSSEISVFWWDVLTFAATNTLEMSWLLIENVCFSVATNSAGDVLICRQKISVFVDTNTTGDVLTSHQKYIFCWHKCERDVLTCNQIYLYYIAIKHDWRRPDFSSGASIFWWDVLTSHQKYTFVGMNTREMSWLLIRNIGITLQ